MKLLIKLSGKIIDNKKELQKFVSHVKKLVKKKIKIVIIHGGGVQVSKWMQDLGLKPKFVNGLRVTDEKTLEVVTSILCGLVNKKLVLQFVNSGVKKVVGISCIDNELLVTKLIPSLGYVGKDVVRINPEIIDILLNNGYLILLSTVGLGVLPNGSSLVLANINADDAVSAITEKLKFDKVVLITDKPGVLNKNGKVLKKLCVSKISELIQQGVVTEGMIPKLTAVKKMFLSGVKKIVITNNLLKEGTVLKNE